MSVNLRKGQKIDLTKDNAGLKNLMVGLGWDEAGKNGGGILGMFKTAAAIDCDASVILCDANGKSSSSDIVYFGNLRDPSGSIVHQGDNLTGKDTGESDDERIFINLSTIPQRIGKLAFVVNIYDADVKKQHFGMIKNAYIRLVDTAKKNELCRYDLSENYDGMTGLVVGEIYRRDGEWKFSAVGQPVRDASRLDKLLALYQ
jgi:stress response protein SCP2